MERRLADAKNLTFYLRLIIITTLFVRQLLAIHRDITSIFSSNSEAFASENIERYI